MYFVNNFSHISYYIYIYNLYYYININQTIFVYEVIKHIIKYYFAIHIY